MKKILLTDLQKESVLIKKETLLAIERVIDKADYILGEELSNFENKFADFCHSQYCVGVANGTAALFLALKSAGIGVGDEVITTSISFAATVEAIILSGATPRLVDVTKNNLLIDAEKIEKLINKKTKAIIPVYLYGFPTQIKKIRKLCDRYDLLLIGDCAQAHGAYYEGNIVGSQEDMACFSFMPAKNLGAYGDAGCVVTNNKFFYENLKKLRDHGRSSKYVHEIFGYAERMDNLQAAVLNVKLSYLEEWNKRRREIANLYINYFNGFDNVIILSPFKKTSPCYHQFVVILKNRDQVKSKLLKLGVCTGLHYPIPLHLQPSFKKLGYKEGDFPVA